MNRLIISLLSGMAVLGLLAANGCSKTGAQPAAQAPTPPTVSVAEVIHQPITEWDEYTGRLVAPQTVDIRPRVSGFINKVNFEEGSLVEEGDLLFEIDPRPFKAEVSRLTAELASARARYDLARNDLARAQRLVKQKAISQDQVDTRLAEERQAEAAVEATTAALETAQLNLEFTRVVAPISGRVSRAQITQGNLVNAGESLLTTLVSTDKIYAYFVADERTYLDYLALAKSGERPSSREHRNPAYLGLANEEGYPHLGYIDFVDNRVDPGTGTIRGRAVFDNSDQTFIPGLFARIKLVASGQRESILIDDRAVGTDLSNKFVLVLKEDNTVEYRQVELGSKLNGLRIVKSGLEPGEKIVVNGLQRVRPGAPVTPEFTAMAEPEVLESIAVQERVVERSNAVLNRGELVKG